MKFTRLRLLGFKTFVEPTEMLIEPGLTGIVGPNGCGKSNLVEAMRWAMGESSYKAFRAQDMDDVIFSGTTGRPSRNAAEVALHLDNSDRTAPAAFNDNDALEVVRRIERGAGSSYRINGRDVRARDVHLLFADASTGARSPALVRQGQIGEIVGAKPAARRRILEEAAGVAGLHARRHEAELRLKAAEQNLVRLEDVVGQMSGQIDSLRRQSRQAVRYRALSEEVRRHEAVLLWSRWREAAQQLADAERAGEAAVREVAERTRDQAEAARLQAIAAHQLPGLRQAEAEAAARLQRLTLARSELDKEEARLSTRRQELERRMAQLGQDMERERALSADAEGMLERLREEAEALADEQADAAEAARDGMLAVADAERVLLAAEQALEERTRAYADVGARRSALEAQARDARTRLARAAAEQASVNAEETRLRQESGSADLDRRREEAEIARERLFVAEDAAGEAEAAHQAARQELEAARQVLGEAERAFGRLDAEVRTLEKLLAAVDHRFPPVVDLLRVEKGFEIALGAALGDDLDLPVDPAATARWAGGDPSPHDPTLPEGAMPLARVVSGSAALARRLAQVGIVSREDGARLAAGLRSGQRLVTREGDLWRWDGVVAAAHAPTAAARRLAERNRLADLRDEVEGAREKAAELRQAALACEAAQGLAAAREAQSRDARRAAQRALEGAREAEAAAERKAGQHAARLSALAEARGRIAAAREEGEEALAATEASLAALEAPALIDADLAAARGAAVQARTRVSEVRAAAAAIERERAGRLKRLEAIAREEQSWRERAGGTDQRIADLDQRRSEAAEDLLGLEDAPAELQMRRRRLLSELEVADAARREAADRLADGDAALAAADRAARDTLEAMAAAREATARAEGRLEAARQRRDDSLREITEAFGATPEGVRDVAGLAPGAEPPPLPETEAALDRARRDRERLGAVNLRAEIELQEAEAQFGSLTGERDDLTEAIKRLRGGIQSLNREARERLQASFVVVDGHFRKLFDTLFGGGEAQLVLTDADDPLEAGLDIIAKPPGKKPQTLSLLSGGEQALTAMALIFAVFLTNPAPICVLDEVDAPLDDANVERFCTLLDEMTRLTDTRFLTITHNPITMARMNRLFGVTMAERGISRLVSVDLQGAERLREVS